MKMRKTSGKLMSMILTVMLLAALAQPAFAAEEPDFAPTPPYIYQDHTADAASRVDEILGLLTLDEKIAMATSGSAQAVARIGLNQARSGSLEAVHGAMRSGKATVFPATLGLSQTWDKELLFKVGDIIAKEALASGQVGALSPIFDILRDPRYGRAYETFGEDAYLIGSLGSEMARGMNQRTDDGYQQFLPIVKHFMAYGNEINRLWTNSSIPLRSLNEYYIKSFQIPVSDGTVKSLMSSYPLVNGKPMSVSPLMYQLLNDWTPDYEGTGHYEYRTINDYGSGSSMWMHSQRYFPDTPDGRALGSAEGFLNGQMSWSFRNQIESDRTTGLEARAQIYDAFARGILTEEDAEELARRNIALGIRMGDYDQLGIQNPYTAYTTPTRADVIADGREAALKTSQEQIVLLKNDDATLPLRDKSSAVLLGSMGEDIMKDNYTGASYYNITIKDALSNKLGIDNLFYDRAVDTFAIKASNGKYLSASGNVFREPGSSTPEDIPILAVGEAETDNDVQMSELNLLFEFYDFGDVYQELRTPINDLFVQVPQLVEAQANRGALVNNTYGAGQGSAGVNETEWVNFMKFYVVETDDGKHGIYTPVNGNGAINNFGESAMAHEDDEDVNNGTYFGLVESGEMANQIVADPVKEFVGPYRNENHEAAADITNSPFDVNGGDEVVDNLPDEYKFDFQTVRGSTDAIKETIEAAPEDAPVILVVGYEAHLNAREPVDVQYTGLSKQHQRNIDYITNELGRDLILVVKTNNPMTIGAAVQDNPKVKSILLIAHSGQEEGSALASALFADGYSVPETGWAPAADTLYSPFTEYSEYPGWLDENGAIPAYAPAGRLTATWYASVSDMIGASDDHAPASYRWPAYDEETNDNLSNLHGTIPTGLLTYDIIKGERTYQYLKADPLYEFGYGLTYSQFEYSGLSVSDIADGRFTVSGSITNTGGIASDEVVQIYSAFIGEPSRIVQPSKRLIAYDRLHSIEPGETRSFSFEVDLEDNLGVWDVEREGFIVEAGDYQIKAAKSSSDSGVASSLSVTLSNGGSIAAERDLNRVALAETFDDYSNLGGGVADIELVSSSIDFHSNTAVQFRQNGAWINFKNVNIPEGTSVLTMKVGSDRDGAIKVYQLPAGSDADALASAQPAATIDLSDSRPVPSLPTGLGIGPFSVTNETLLNNTPNPGSPVGQDGLDVNGIPYKYAYLDPEYKTESAVVSVEPGSWDIYLVTESRGSQIEWFKFGSELDTTESLDITNINQLSSILEKGGSLPLRADLSPVSSVSDVSWAVTNLDGSATAIAQISEDGVLTAAGAGNGTVLVTVESNGKSASREILVTNQLDSDKAVVDGVPKTVDYLMLRTGTSFGATDNIQRFEGTNQQTAVFAELFSENEDNYYLSGKRYLEVTADQIDWTITDLNGAPTDIATVSDSGLVAATGIGDGKVVVTAALKSNPDITVSRAITLSNQSTKDPFKMVQAENYDVFEFEPAAAGESAATAPAPAYGATAAPGSAATAFGRGGNEFGLYVPTTANGTKIGYKNIDFGSVGSDKAYFRIASAVPSYASLWIDGYTEGQGGKQIATLEIPGTGNDFVYKTFSVSLNEIVTGEHDVYLVFPGAVSRINWFQFAEAGAD